MMKKSRHTCFASRFVPLAILMLFLLPIKAVPAQDESVERLKQSLEATRAKLAGIESASRRLTQLEKIIAQRQMLIEAHPDDPQRAIWLVDQASDLFYEVLGIEAAGLTVLFGHPSPSQLAVARRVTQEIHEFASRAEAHGG